MKRLDSRIFWGALLILMGVLFMLESLGLVTLTAIWPLLFILGGILFLVLFILRKENWWAAIPGFTLMGLSALIGLDLIFRELPEGDWGGVIFLGSIALSFFAIYLRTLTQQWWALIPAGVLTTIIAVISMETALPALSDEALGGVFLLGIGLTFTLVYLLPTGSGRQTWAAIPAVVLVAVGLLGVVAMTNLLIYAGPVAMIILGLYILLRHPFKKE